MLSIPDNYLKNNRILSKSIYDLDQYSSVIKINIKEDDNLKNKLNISNDNIRNDLGINDYSKYGKVVDPNDKVEVIKTGISHGVEKATDEVKNFLNKTLNIDMNAIKLYGSLFLLAFILIKLK